MARDGVTAEQPEYLPTAHVAVMLNVTPQTVRDHIHSGELRGIRVGRLFRVHRDDLAAYLLRARSRAVAQ